MPKRIGAGLPWSSDFDNDSYRDIIITNGFPKDVSDHDFTTYRRIATNLASKTDILKQIPEIKIHNYAYHNNGDLTFADVTNNWGFSDPTLSNGAAYVDLNNDGAMDVVINNINGEALVYRNTLKEKEAANNHYLQVNFKGGKENINGIGATATIYYDNGKMQKFENNPYRGYLSSVQQGAHFGLGKITAVDSVVVAWNNQQKQTIKDVKADQVLTVDIKDAENVSAVQASDIDSSAIFRDVTKSLDVSYKHTDFNFIDFNVQSVLPHKFTEYCPALASADVDGNGLDDIIVGGNSSNPAQVLLQQKNGSFIQKNVYNKQILTSSFKDEGVLLFDANGDGKPDLYVSSGGFKEKAGSKYYQDRLYINDGKGNFKYDSLALPQNYTSKLCVRAFDYNKDGKLDLFVSGRVDPWLYPKPVSSFIFRNDTKDGQVKFTDVTNEVAPDLKNIGMVCDALFSDFDNDGQTDLILAGELMPVTFLKNDNGKFKNVTATTGISNKLGMWNSIAGGDFRHTGRIDYIVGNVGSNTLYQPTDKYPVYVTAGDFANNGGYEVIPSLYLSDINGELKEFPANGRDEIIERLPALKKQYPDYKSFAVKTMDEIFPPEQRKNMIRLKANTLQSCYIRNDGNGKFTIIPLPKQAQVSVLNGMVVDDFDGDGNLDVLISGNDYGTDIAIGRYDALNGLLLRGNGSGGFTPLSLQKSGIYIPGDGKALVKLTGNAGNYLVAASQNRDALKIFEMNAKPKTININADDVSAVIHFNDGKIQKQEFYYGASFLSQSGRFMVIPVNASAVDITNASGKMRKVSFR